MAAPGRIRVAINERQVVLDTDEKMATWYRVTNSGSGTMGVTYFPPGVSGNRSAQITSGRSMDFYTTGLEIRHDGGGTVEGTYESLD